VPIRRSAAGFRYSIWPVASVVTIASAIDSSAIAGALSAACAAADSAANPGMRNTPDSASSCA
jgi:hypothetical protein